MGKPVSRTAQYFRRKKEYNECTTSKIQTKVTGDITNQKKKNLNSQNNQLLGDGPFPFLENTSSFFAVAHLREGFFLLLGLILRTCWKFSARAEKSLRGLWQGLSVQLYRTIYRLDPTGYLRANISRSPVAGAQTSLLHIIPYTKDP